MRRKSFRLGSLKAEPDKVGWPTYYEQVMATERDERIATGPTQADIQARLFGLRKRFRELGC